MVSWFQYFTNPSSLDEDLQSDDKLKDSDKLKLMKEFLYEADQCDKKMEHSRKQTSDVVNNISMGQLSPLPIFTDIQSNYGMDIGRENYIQQMKKSHVLYILALKVFANLQFNINLIHIWGVPLCLMGNLHRTFLKISTGVPNVNPVQDVDWPGWTPVSRFAQVVYHFWTLLEGLDRVLIKSHRRCLTPSLPGLTEVPDMVFVNENSVEESAIVSRLEQSALILTVLLERPDVLYEVPINRSFRVPDLDTDTTIVEEALPGVSVSTESVNANIRFFLGRHCFQRKEFEKALGYFRAAQEPPNSAHNGLFFVGTTPMLVSSYISLCKRLCHQPVSRFMSPSQTIEDQISRRQWHVDLLTETLMRDVHRRCSTECSADRVINSGPGNGQIKEANPVSLGLRERLEREMRLSLVPDGDKIPFFKVSVCNLLERVLSGHALLTTFIADLGSMLDTSQTKEVLLYLLHQTATCLALLAGTASSAERGTSDGTDAATEIRRSASCPSIFTQHSRTANGTDFTFETQNLKCFITFLCQTLSPDVEFPAAVIHSDLMRHFAPEEAEEIVAALNDVLIDLDDLDIYDLEDVESEWFSVPPSADERRSAEITESEKALQSILGPASNPNETDLLRLLSSYDCEEIKDVLICLHGNSAINRHSVHGLWTNWSLSQPLLDELKNVKPEFDYLYSFVLLSKAAVLRDLGSWDSARFLYEAVRASLSQQHQHKQQQHQQASTNKLRKLIANEVICNDLQRFLSTYQSLSPANTASPSAPPDSVQELVTSAKQCLTSARLDQNLWISETLIITCCCFLLTVNEFDYLLSVPNTVSSAVELSSLLVTVSRDFDRLSPATKFVKSSKDLFDLLLKVVVPTKKAGVYNCMGQPELRLFLGLLGHCGLLDLLLSGLVSILTCLRSDISLSRPLYPKDIWPTTISSNFNTAIDTAPLDSLVVLAIDRALSQDPHNHSWLCTRADLAMAEGDYRRAVRLYLEAGAAATHHYTTALPKDLFSDWLWQQMVRACREMGFYHQAVFLCQYIPDISVAAQLASQVTVSNDSSDLYVHLMWDVNLMEILAAIEFERGAFSKHRRFIDALSQPDMSANNSPDIILACQERKKLEFLRLLSMQYLMR